MLPGDRERREGGSLEISCACQRENKHEIKVVRRKHIYMSQDANARENKKHVDKLIKVDCRKTKDSR